MVNEDAILEDRIAIQRAYQKYDYRRWLFHLYGLPRPITMLDVGCGTGADLISFSRAINAGVGIDASEKLIEEAAGISRKLPNVYFKCGRAENYRSNLLSFDLIVSNFAFYYFDLGSAIEMMRRNLQTNGTIFIAGSPDENAREFSDLVFEILGDDVPTVFAKGFADVRKYEEVFRLWFHCVQFYRLINPIHLPTGVEYLRYVVSTPMYNALPIEKRSPFLQKFSRRIAEGENTITKVVDVMRVDGKK